MKCIKFIVVIVLSFLILSVTSQQYENFYTTKDNLEPYYDSLIQILGIDNMQGTGYKYYERWVKYWEPKLYPHGDFNTYQQDLEQYVADFVSGNAPQSITPFTIEWNLIGPNKMPDGSSKWAKGLGQIHYIAFDPNYSTNQKLFACSPVGGLWRSLDGGNSWFSAGTDKGLPQCGVSSIAIDHQNAETHWFITTGDAEGLNTNVWQQAIGVWRTIDAGTTWEQIGLEQSTNIRKVILKRYQGNVHLFVATTSGLYECENALVANPTFTELIDGNFYDVEFDPQYSGIVYASGTGLSTSVYKIDFINNIYNELPNISTIPVENGRRLIIEISEVAPNNLFIVATYKGTNKDAYLYKYTLSTNTIILKGQLPRQGNNEQGIGPERAMGWAISPVLNGSGELIMVHGNTAPIRQSNNLLDNNNCVWVDVTSTYFSCEIHVDMHYMVFEPDGQTLWVGSDGGVFKSTMPDLLNNWEEKNDGLAVSTVYHLAASELNKDVALSGAFDCGSNLYSRNNNEWNEKHVLTADGFQCQINWRNPDTIWASKQSRVYRSDNGGDNFYNINGNLHWHTYFIQNNVFPEILYGANADGILRTSNFGNSWQNYANYPGVSNNSTWRVTNSITHGNYIYTSWIGNTSGNPQKVFKSVTGGGTSTNDWEDIGSPLIDGWITSIAVNYFDPDHIWVSTGGYVYDVNTITHQWVDISIGLPSSVSIQHLEILPGLENVLFAGTNYGLYYYSQSEGSWQFVDGILPNVEISDIQIDILNKRIVVGTFGRGVWEANLPCFIDNSDITYITSDQTWEVNRAIAGILSIEADKTLTLKNSNLIMNQGAKIIVKPGAKLIIEDTKITNSCSKPWDGIEVWGDPTAHQFPDANGNYQQGYLEIKDSAIIENAQYGVRLWNSDAWDDYGGIVQANGAIFRNNLKAVEFMNYQNFDPTTGEPRPNQSYFTGCTFETTDDYDDIFSYPFEAFVTAWKVDGIEFRGNTFTDYREYFNMDMNKSMGIRTIDANFIVYPFGAKRNRFEGLLTGIYSSQLETNNTYRVDKTDFVDNQFGIYNTECDFASCIRSDFYLGTKEPAPYNEINVGLLNTYSTGFTYEQNEFGKSTGYPPGHELNYGIWNVITGANTNIIYKNDFTSLHYSNMATGLNRDIRDEFIGLIYQCNDNNTNIWYDFLVQDGRGIAQNQGYSDEAAGNTFSHNSTPLDSDFANYGVMHVNYYYYDGDPDQEPINAETKFTAIPVSSENNCPDHFPEGIDILLDDNEITALRTQYALNKDEYNNTRVLYESLKDGGDTPGTILDIESSWPDETWELRAQLLVESPHLSEEVLMEAAIRTDVLPHTIMFEICVANPEEMRNERFLDFLATKDEPMPQYMIEDLRDSADLETYKSVLQSEMSKYNMLYSSACTQIIRNILLDLTGIQYDSLRVWLGKTGTLDAAYQIVDSYLAQEDYTNATQTLSNIPDDFELTDEQDKEYDYFYDLKSIIITANQQNRNALLLDSTEVADLVLIADSSNSIAGAQVRSLLNFAYGYNYFSLPVTVKPGDKVGRVNDFSSIKYNYETENLIIAHPNPARQWVAFDYEIPYPSENGVIVITDINGRQIDEKYITGSNGQIIWDTRDVSPGIYFYSLIVHGNILDKQKLIISK